MIEIDVFIEGSNKRIGLIVQNGKSSCRRFIESLEERVRNRLIVIMERMANYGFVRNVELFKHLGDKIYEFKAKNIRVLCFFYQDLIICTHGCSKKKKKQLIVEIEKAKKLMNEFLKQEEM